MMPDSAFDIVACFVIIDDTLTQLTPTVVHPGRPAALTDSELLTIVVYGTLAFKPRTLRHLWQIMRSYHRADFPTFPAYPTFVSHTHRCLPLLGLLLKLGLMDSSLRFLDSTKLPVCANHRASRHRVAKGVAAFGKNHQGWWYGFKLHAAVDAWGRLCSVYLTPANIHDQNITPRLTDGHTRIAVGDGGYRSSVMNHLLWEQRGVYVLTPPHWKQRQKIAATWQNLLLSWRSKLESVFDILKEHLPLVSSFPRSVTGYLVHYLRVLLAYQCAGV